VKTRPVFVRVRARVAKSIRHDHRIPCTNVCFSVRKQQRRFSSLRVDAPPFADCSTHNTCRWRAWGATKRKPRDVRLGFSSYPAVERFGPVRRRDIDIDTVSLSEEKLRKKSPGQWCTLRQVSCWTSWFSWPSTRKPPACRTVFARYKSYVFSFNCDIKIDRRTGHSNRRHAARGT